VFAHATEPLDGRKKISVCVSPSYFIVKHDGKRIAIRGLSPEPFHVFRFPFEHQAIE
jgi:hypothetical protein